MASESETVIGVLAEWRDCIESADPSVWNDERIAGLVKTTKAQQLEYLARIEAAWKREKAEIEADALAVGGIVEAARHTPGNAAAMREALLRCEAISCLPEIRELQCVRDMRNIIADALSSPARNCDFPFVVDGPADNDANKAWLVFKKHNPDAYFDVSGLLRCVDWLFATAERKGEN